MKKQAGPSIGAGVGAVGLRKIALGDAEGFYSGVVVWAACSRRIARPNDRSRRFDVVFVCVD